MLLDKVTCSSVAGETPPEKIESYRVFSAWTVDFGTCDSGLTILAIPSYQHSLMDNGGVFGQVCQEEFYSFRYRLLNGLQSAFQIVLFCNSASRDIVALLKLSAFSHADSQRYLWLSFVTEITGGVTSRQQYVKFSRQEHRSIAPPIGEGSGKTEAFVIIGSDFCDKKYSPASAESESSSHWARILFLCGILLRNCQAQ